MNRLELKVPPPVIGLVVAALMWLAARHAQALAFDFPGREAVALLFALAGAFADLAGLVSFRRARTTVNPLRPGSTSTLVTSGIYRFTRNPMYLGMLLLLVAWSAWLGNALALLLAALFVLYIGRFQIAPEERMLSRLFGPDFDAYRGQVRRWL